MCLSERQVCIGSGLKFLPGPAEVRVEASASALRVRLDDPNRGPVTINSSPCITTERASSRWPAMDKIIVSNKHVLTDKYTADGIREDQRRRFCASSPRIAAGDQYWPHLR